jgi:putative ABC transport system ATP-binding protein
VHEIALAAHDVSVDYGRGTAAAHALSDVSLDFEAGKVTLLMGESGSGKTTLLSVLGCLRTADRGFVTVLGRNLSGSRESELVLLRRRHIGFIFQFFRLFRSLNALENVRLSQQVAGQQRGGAARPEEALEMVGLSRKMQLKPDQLSGGERQRVAIARALVKNPQILLADEPTAALDSASGSQIAELIRTSAKERGMVAVIATHDSRILHIADRIVEMRDGKVIQDRGKIQ